MCILVFLAIWLYFAVQYHKPIKRKHTQNSNLKFVTKNIAALATGLVVGLLLGVNGMAADQLWTVSAGDHDVTTIKNWVAGHPSVDSWQASLRIEAKQSR